MLHSGIPNYIDVDALVENDPDLNRKKGHSFAITSRWFLSWIHKNGHDFSVSSARQFVSEVTNSRKPSDWQLKLWKDGLNWLFKNSRSSKMSYNPVLPPSKEDPLHQKMRVGQYSESTERTYRVWINKFSEWFQPRDIGEMTDDDLRDFLSYLAVYEKVSKSTQQIALNAMIYYCRKIQNREPGDLSDFRRARAKKREPVVLSQNEVKNLLEAMTGTSKLMASVMYGGGLRISELLELRVKDIDIERRDVVIHGGKGDKDRRTLLPTALVEDLGRHLLKVHNLWSKDQAEGMGPTILPEALGRKFKKQSYSYEWQWLFPGKSKIWNDQLKVHQRVPFQSRTFTRHLQRASKKASICKRISPHVLRHCFATHMIEAGITIDRLQELMGHSSIETTRIYLHVARNENEISPFDRLYT